MATQAVTYLTPGQYLELEAQNEFRSELVHGEIFAMSETSPQHSWLVSNTLGEIGRQLRRRPCGARANEVRLYIERFESFTYPDVVATCGFSSLYKDGRTITDATAIVEVLSPSTQDYDRGEEFRLYRGLPSFANYLVLAQDEMRAEFHTSMPDGSWLLREFSAPTNIIELNSIGCRLELQTLYERVEFAARVRPS